jgi:hypothetical protein
VKEHLQGELFESEDDKDAAFTVSLHRLSKDEYKAVTDRLPHKWETCVYIAGGCNE